MKAILYINQFFGQIGGEEFADHEPEIREGLVGPGIAYANALKEEIEITHTIICGDNFMGSNTEEAVKRILEFLADKEFDIFFAGQLFVPDVTGQRVDISVLPCKKNSEYQLSLP